MKSEERHELQQNDLASWVYTLPILLKKYGSYILLAGSCCVLAFVLWQRYQQTQEANLQAAWDKLSTVNEESTENPPAKLRDIIATSDSRTVQAEAYRRLGKFYLQTVLAGNPADGVRGVKISREDALNQAEISLKKVTTDYADFPIPLASAYLDLGALEESRRNWDAARAWFQKLTDKAGPFAGTAFAAEAEYHLASFDKYKTPITFGPAKPLTTAPSSQPTTTTSRPSFLEGIELK